MSDNPFIEYFSKHWSKFLLGGVALIIALLTIERLNHSRHIKHKKALIESRISQDQFAAGYPLDIDSITLIERVVKKHPHLHPRYDTLLTQNYLAQQSGKKAAGIAQSAIKRTKGLTLSYYTQYAQTSLLINENKLGQALINAEKLAVSLRDHTPTEKLQQLQAFNLLRIVFLSKASGNSARAQSAFGELGALNAYQDIAPLFSEGEVTLDHFLKNG